MAILCLLLGLLCVLGFGSSQDPTSNIPTTKMSSANPSQPNVVASSNPPTPVVTSSNPPPAVPATDQPSIALSTKQPDAGAATTITPQDVVIVTTANTAAPSEAPTNVLTTITANVNAPHTKAATTLANAGHAGPPSSVTSPQVTNLPESPSTVSKQAPISETATSTGTPIVSTKGNFVTTTPGPSKGPEETTTAGPQQIDPNTGSNSISSPETTTIPPPSLPTTPPKDTDRTSPASGSSASPSSTRMSSTTAGAIPGPETDKPIIHPSGSSSVPATSAEITTRKNIESERTANIDNAIKLQEKNIKVNCRTNNQNVDHTSYVKLATGGSSICNNGDAQTTDEFDAMLVQVCKAIKPGYQQNQDKCIVHLARVTENDVAIAEAFIESRLQPKELYTQMKRNGANVKLFSYDDAVPEDEDVVSIPLISAIVSLAVLLLIIAAAYGCWHQRKARKREQRLTEELQTMENGYHDNPTLEVMETSPEMQEKKGGPNGELGDSWIVPLDNLTREDLEEEEDTHL